MPIELVANPVERPVRVAVEARASHTHKPPPSPLQDGLSADSRQHLVPLVPKAMKLLDQLKQLSGDSLHVFPGPTGDPMNWVQKACAKVMTNAGIDDGRHHDTRRVLQKNMAEVDVPPHVADMTSTMRSRALPSPASTTTRATTSRRSAKR